MVHHVRGDPSSIVVYLTHIATFVYCGAQESNKVCLLFAQKVRWDLQGQRAEEGTTLGSDEGGGIKLGSASLIGGCM